MHILQQPQRPSPPCSATATGTFAPLRHGTHAGGLTIDARFHLSLYRRTHAARQVRGAAISWCSEFVSSRKRAHSLSTAMAIHSLMPPPAARLARQCRPRPPRRRTCTPATLHPPDCRNLKSRSESTRWAYLHYCLRRCSWKGR